MSVKPNGTDAKDIALYFIKQTSGRATPAIIKKTISQVKSILSSGYSKDEIISVVDYLIDSGVELYSFGYISASINDVLKKINEKKEQEKAQEIRKKIMEEQQSKRSKVITNDESRERNREKARRTNLQSRLRKKYNFDMFEEQ